MAPARDASRPFVAVNCGALPENLSSRSCSATRRAPSPARREKHTGKFVEADGGTLFLDEVGELPPAGAGQTVARAPGRRSRAGRRAQAGQGRCAHRLRHQSRPDRRRESGTVPRRSVLSIARVSDTVPPLRERPDDIPELARHFLARIAAEEGKRVRGISAQAMALLAAYRWPGNVRQLENAVFRAIVLAEGERSVWTSSRRLPRRFRRTPSPSSP